VLALALKNHGEKGDKNGSFITVLEGTSTRVTLPMVNNGLLHGKWRVQAAINYLRDNKEEMNEKKQFIKKNR